MWFRVVFFGVWGFKLWLWIWTVGSWGERGARMIRGLTTRAGSHMLWILMLAGSFTVPEKSQPAGSQTHPPTSCKAISRVSPWISAPTVCIFTGIYACIYIWSHTHTREWTNALNFEHKADRSVLYKSSSCLRLHPVCPIWFISFKCVRTD